MSEESIIQDLPDDILEQMLFAELVNDNVFCSRILKIFKDKWIGDDDLRLMSFLIAKWRSRFTTEITPELVTALVKKYAETKPNDNINPAVCLQKFNKALNLNLGNIPKESRIKTINEFIRKNVLVDAIAEGAKLLSHGQLSGVVDNCIAVLEEAERTTLIDSNESLDYNAETIKGLNDDSAPMGAHYKVLANPAAKISTGWPTLDMHTCGGFWKAGKSIYIVMGQAGLGKTVALTNLAYNFLAQGLKVVVFTLEMSNDVYGRRFDALFSNIALDELGPLVDTVKERVTRFFTEHPTAELTIKEFPPHQANANTFTAFIEDLMKKKGGDWKPDVIIVDYLNLVASTKLSNEEHMYQEGIQVTEQLRALSYRFEAPLVTAVQTNTEGMDTSELGMKNIAQSRGIAHAADFIMAIYDSDGVIRGKIIKSRLGKLPSGQTVGFRRDENTLRMIDLQTDFPEEGDGESVSSNNDEDLPDSLKALVDVSQL